MSMDMDSTDDILDEIRDVRRQTGEITTTIAAVNWAMAVALAHARMCAAQDAADIRAARRALLDLAAATSAVIEHLDRAMAAGEAP